MTELRARVGLVGLAQNIQGVTAICNSPALAKKNATLIFEAPSPKWKIGIPRNR